jgi:hypothetical protein
MKPTPQSVLKETLDGLFDTLEQTLEDFSKVAAELEAIKQENEQLKKASAGKEVYLEKVASVQVNPLTLAPVVKRLEQVGFIKEGSAAEACKHMVENPAVMVDLLDAVSQSFADTEFIGGFVEKSASSKEKESPEAPYGEKPYIVHEEWLTLIKK